MEVLPVLDLPRDQATSALKQFRKQYYEEEPSSKILHEVYNRIGGRLSLMTRVAKSPDMLHTCNKICQVEKTWFLNNCWILGEEMDNNVMNQQKYASAAMVLAKALVDREKEDAKTYDPEQERLLPQIPLHKAREIMTRADFIKEYDHINLFTIDFQAMVRADSVPMLNAFRQICSEPGFEEHLNATLERIAAIESLGRTREIVAQDLVSGKYKISGRPDRGDGMIVEVQAAEDSDH